MTIITESSPYVDQHALLPHIKVPLFPHQSRVIHAAVQIENNGTIQLGPSEQLTTNIGFVSCPPGSGKSLVMLALAAMPLPETKQRRKGVNLSTGSYISFSKQQLTTPVIVVPELFIVQWTEYITTFTMYKACEYKVLVKKADMTVATKQAIADDRLKLILCTPIIYNTLADCVFFSRLIIDEVDTIVIPNCKQPHASVIWCASSNKERIMAANVPNRGFIRTTLVELADLAHKYGDAVIWDNLMIATNPEYLQVSIRLPDINHFQINCMHDYLPVEGNNTDNMKKYFDNGLKVVIADFYNIEKVNDINAMLHSFTVNHKTELVELQEKLLNNDFQSRHYVTVDEVEANRLRDNQKTLTARIEDIHLQIENVRNRIRESMCPVTFDSIHTKVCVKCCASAFDAAAIIGWVDMHNNCPVCRTRLNTSDLKMLGPFQYIQYNMSLILLDFVRQASATERILIFTTATRNIGELFTQNGVIFGEFRGRVMKRMIDSYKAGNPNVLMLDTSKFATGLNLQMTTKLLICDNNVDESKLGQIIGRANRIGRLSSLDIYRFNFMT